MIRPRNNYLLAVPKEKSKTTSSGFELTEAAAKEQALATVVKVSEPIKDLKEGDVIVYKPYASADITIENKEYLLIEDNDVIGVIE